MRKIIEQFIKFGLIGFLNTFINYGIFALLVYFHLYYLAANLIAFAITVLIGYFLQTKFVFDGKGQSSAAKIIKAYCGYGFSNGILENVILWICISKIGMIEYVAKIIPMFITIPTNFLLQKYWVFKEGAKNSEST